MCVRIEAGGGDCARTPDLIASRSSECSRKLPKYSYLFLKKDSVTTRFSVTRNKMNTTKVIFSEFGKLVNQK